MAGRWGSVLLAVVIAGGALATWLMFNVGDRPCRNAAPGSITEMSCGRLKPRFPPPRLPGE